MRLNGYDYSQDGAYFITICTHNREWLFGEINNGAMILNGCGLIAENEMMSIENHYDNVKINIFTIMPNHIHAIVVISETERINPFPTGVDIPNIIGKFKAGVTRIVGNAFMRSVKIPIWQKSYHDRIIRDEHEYDIIWQYIDENPSKWEEDCFFAKSAQPPLQHHPNNIAEINLKEHT